MVKKVRVVYSLIPHVFIPLPIFLDTKEAELVGSTLRTERGKYEIKPLSGVARLGAYVFFFMFFALFLLFSMGSKERLVSFGLSFGFPAFSALVGNDIRLEFVMLGLALIGSVIIYGINGFAGFLGGATSFFVFRLCYTIEKKLLKTIHGILFIIEKEEEAS